MNKVLLQSGKDDWETPQELFEKLDREFHFTLDACSTHENAKCKRHFTVEENGLAMDWAGETVFCNPPYSKIGKQDDWVRKCYEEAQKPGTVVVALLPSRTDTERFHRYILNKAEIRFIPGRLCFEQGGIAAGKATFPSMICIWRGKEKALGTMRNLGDITKLSGYDVPAVDVVIGGSPCQNLSIAGNRAGLAGQQSGLFMEQIRLIKEMRDADICRGRADQLIRPRFMVWENVPGAFSSNKGEDFRVVLEETARIAEPDAVIPRPPKKWRTSGCILGNGWSIAWRVLDAQFWGVPQRRRRIALIADFGGNAAPEILFVRKSVCGDIAQSAAAWEEAAAGVGNSSYSETARRLPANYDGSQCGDRSKNIVVAGFKPHAGASAGNIGYEEEISPTLGTGKPMAVYDARGNGDGKTVCNLTGDHERRVSDYSAIVVEPLPFDTTQITSPQNRSNPHHGDPCHPLAAGAHAPAIAIETGQANAAATPLYNLSPTLNCNHEQPIVFSVNCRNAQESADLSGTLQAHQSGGNSLNCNNPIRIKRQIRRLTPLECERLQGYPDGWTDIGAWRDGAGKLNRLCSATPAKKRVKTGGKTRQESSLATWKDSRAVGQRR